MGGLIARTYSAVNDSKYVISVRKSENERTKERKNERTKERKLNIDLLKIQGDTSREKQN